LVLNREHNDLPYTFGIHGKPVDVDTNPKMKTLYADMFHNTVVP